MKKEEINTLFQKSKILIISTGAGMGKDSGLPTFRNEGGLWGQVESEEGKSIFEVSNPAFLAENLLKAWQLYAQRMKMFAEHQPHEGFAILKKWVKSYFEDYFVLTSNIDSYFQRAGFDKHKIRELHGSMAYLQCAEPNCQEVWENEVAYESILKMTNPENLPKSKCNPKQFARPNIYMFRDYSFVYTRVHEQKERFEKFLITQNNKPKIVLEIGSGPHVQSIRMKTRDLIKNHQATLIRINPKDFKVRQGHFGIADSALSALKMIDNALKT